MNIVKLFSFLILLALPFACSNGSEATVEKTVHVYGNCEKCKATIDKAAKLDGVKEADWHIDSKLLTVKYDSTKTNLDLILKSVAKAGYDNEVYTGDDYAYQKLPSCCHYERKEN